MCQRWNGSSKACVDASVCFLALILSLLLLLMSEPQMGLPPSSLLLHSIVLPTGRRDKERESRNESDKRRSEVGNMPSDKTAQRYAGLRMQVTEEGIGRKG